MAFRRQCENFRKLKKNNDLRAGTECIDCRPLYPASSRLQSIPPRYYDVVDTNTNQVVDSDLHRLVSRGRSRARNSELRDGWTDPRYSDLVVGSTAHPGHRAPR